MEEQKKKPSPIRHAFPSFSTVETLISVMICGMILFPIGGWIQQYSSALYQDTKQNSVYYDVLFLMEDIETQWTQFMYEPISIRPKEGISEQILSFKTVDQKLIRYYTKGNEVGRDIGYGTFQNLTQKVIRRFMITRYPDGESLQIQICIEDIMGRTYSRMLFFPLTS
ncbi:MAG: hypothetical protein PHX86_03110 [Caldisericia bacterium]|nr:hypothetical protein [Caldisericia bacterium]